MIKNYINVHSFYLKMCIIHLVVELHNAVIIMLVPVKINIRGTIVCTSLHEGRQVTKATLPIHIDQLFTLLFTNSKFFLDFHTARKTTGNKIILILLLYVHLSMKKHIFNLA